MKSAKLLVAIGLSTLVLAACEEEADTTACVHIATVDHSAQDCGPVLRIEGGGQVIPTWTYGWCGTGVDVDRIDSLETLIRQTHKVRFGYSLSEFADPCQGIPYAYITCLEVLERSEVDTPTR